MKKHQEHIVCIKSETVKNREHGFVEYELNSADLMLGQRASLEKDDTFRQLLPISVFTHKGKVWAYERTNKGGENRLHNKIAVAVGGHWDLDDLVIKGSIINLHESLKQTMQRELKEEVNLTSNIIKTMELEKKICADDTEVDRHHIAVVYVHELDGEGVNSSEEQLKTVGFVSPTELLSGKYNIEAWARIICEILTKVKNNNFL
ncbi:NUDIX domain-containing protein [Paraglaciecola sp. L1A13]|uniref:NUDIX domain-containing protein n=1 Tax=Paraglaciecola sp. L1A13 TaxID=2686359 RepID=UPI00131ADA83|nr:NUDIX domain-containing protein [Paraglaciecola sp. L1A13]